ncbi:iron dependent repressor, metal binding and dimerization domain protein, partial [Staphylococcus epidermidis]|uniref:iron dependent repressor, metal binding and dimerization domain protein n=1 Tax=Staphylococcus epidermidis TaxID=1282 RepID=UPI0028CB7466
LQNQRYVQTKHYKPPRLTQQALNQTLHIIKPHPLLQLFLIQILQYNSQQLHQQTQILEHPISHLFLHPLHNILNFP